MRYDLDGANRRLQIAVSRTRSKPAAASAPAPAKYPLLYALTAALFTLIGIGGLFLGFAFPASPVAYAIAGGTPIMEGSLFGVIIEIVRGSISFPALSGGLSGALPAALYLLVIVLTAALFCALVCTIFAFLFPARARTLAYLSGYVLLLSYGAVCAVGLVREALVQEFFTERLLDFPTAVTVLALALAMTVLTAVRFRGRAAVNFLLFVFSALSLLSIAHPLSPILLGLENALSGVYTETSMRIALFFYAAFLILGLVFSALRLGSSKRLWPDIARFGLQFIAACALLVTYLLSGVGFLEFFESQIFATVALFLMPLAAFFVAAFSASVYAGRREEPARAPRAKPAAAAL